MMERVNYVTEIRVLHNKQKVKWISKFNDMENQQKNDEQDHFNYEIKYAKLRTPGIIYTNHIKKIV